MAANRQLIVGLAATFVGLTAVLAVAGVVLHPLLLAVAVPFGITASFLWYHATGRLADRVRRVASNATPREQVRARRRARAMGYGREAFAGARAGARGGRTAEGGGSEREHRSRRRSASGAASGAATGRASSTASGAAAPTRREAYATLGLQPDADGAAIRRAYRERAKELHPDAADGDEAAFKELTDAYDRLSDARTS